MRGVLSWVIPGRKQVKVVMLPTEKVEKSRKEREKRRLKAAKHRNAKAESTDSLYKNKFIAWDGEGPQDAGYALFGNSEGDEICHPYLSTAECFDLLFAAAAKYQGAIHIWFGGNYDVSMILKDVGIRVHRALKKSNRAVWGEYEIEHIPHKWMQVKWGSLKIKIFDIHSFFGTSYIKALIDFKVGDISDMEVITSGKRNRSEFVWAEIDEIRTYFRTELRA
jgi:hypothetical protein